MAEVAMLDNEDQTLHRCGDEHLVTACGLPLDHVTVTRRDVLEPKAARFCTDCFPLCDGCGKRPYQTHYEDMALCQECLAAIQYEIEDEE
jgi:hypothetical protein